MIRGFLARLLLSVAAVACFAVLVWQLFDDRLSGELPFQIETRGQEQVLRARAGVPLPAPLADGEIIDLKQMSVRERAALSLQETYFPGSAVTLWVRRADGEAQRVTVAATAAAPNKLRHFDYWAVGATWSFVLAMALLTLWRGRDATAGWMCVFAGGVLLVDAIDTLMMSPAVSLWLAPWDELIRAVYIGAICGTAVSAARPGLSQRWRRVSLLLTALALSLAVAARIFGHELLLAGQGIVAPQWLMGGAIYVSASTLIIAVLSLLVGYAHAPPESRGRMRWILLSTAILTASVSGQILFSSTNMNLPVAYAVSNVALPGLSLLGYLYAILSTRIVDVTVVIDRALVYSVITALVFGLFSLLEDAVHRLALGEQLSWIVQAAGALAVAAVMSPLHRLLDKGLERVFFHKLRMMAASLRTLGKESAFFENEAALMARVLKQLRVSCASAAIYERSGAVYMLRSASGEGWAGAVDADDPLFVTLRSGRQVLDLKDRDSAAGAEGLAFPMAVGQILTGAVVTRLREGEQLDSELRAALAELAQALGTSLYLLRYRELAALAAEISAGKLGLEAARSRATELAGGL